MDKTRIMLVEDEAITAMDIQTKLEGLGYDVPVVLASGIEAISVAKELKPDLILMDITLDGDMTGIEAAEHILITQRIPIIFLTAHRDGETLASAKTAEPFGYLTKPCSLDTLKNTIEVALYRSEADARVRESEDRYRTLVRQAPVAITVLCGGSFCYCNPAAVRLFGAINEEELLNRPILEVVHPDSRSRVWERIATTLAIGEPTTATIERFIRLDGVDIIAEVIGIPTTYQGKPAVQKVFRDITAQIQAQVALKKLFDELEARVAERTSALEKANQQMKKVSFELVWAEELERERIAGELHDQVGQSLLLAKMKLDALADKITSDSLSIHAEEVNSLLAKSIHDIRTLTFRMRPPILDTASIETALEWLCSSVGDDYAIQIDFSSDGQSKPLSREVRYSVYQAVRELLLNVVKHAKTEKAQLTIKNDNNTLVVQIADNGVGFIHPDANFQDLNSGGYGIYIVQQRIEQMDGRFVVESAPGKGTTVTLMIPYPIEPE